MANGISLDLALPIVEGDCTRDDRRSVDGRFGTESHFALSLTQRRHTSAASISRKRVLERSKPVPDLHLPLDIDQR